MNFIKYWERRRRAGRIHSPWNNANNTIECIGAGGAGADFDAVVNNLESTGDGGGEYAAKDNVVLPIGQAVAYQIGQGGISTALPTAEAGTATWFKDTATVLANGGEGGHGNGGFSLGGTGGIGDRLFPGGRSQITGGGGAAGPNGPGGIAAIAADLRNSIGGKGDNGHGGEGGTFSGPGGHGEEWGPYGSGGGGAAGGAITDLTDGNAGAGGPYGGGGGGGASVNNDDTTALGAAGANGIIRITYEPTINIVETTIRRSPALP